MFTSINLLTINYTAGYPHSFDHCIADPGYLPSLSAAQAVIKLWRGVAIGLTLREEGRDYLSGVTAFRTAVPSSFACSSMAASCFFTYSD